MSEKTIIYSPEGAGYGNNGLDPNLWASLMNNGGMGGFGGGNFLTILFLLAIFGRNGFNSGNYDLGYIGTQLSNGFQGDVNAISNLSTQLNCSIGQVQSGIAAVQSAVQNVANQTGMSGMQIINAVNAGDANIISTLQSCCCDLKTTVNNQGYENRINNLQQSQLIQNGFSQVGYAAAEQTCAIKQNNTDNTNRVLAKLDAIEDSRKDREIASLTAALTAANSRAERQAELAPIYKQLNDIACRQPSTVTVPNPSAVAVPACVAWQMGLNGLGLGLPYANGGIFG